MEIGRIFTFDAAHYLPGYDGKCANVHGHTYRLGVNLEGKVNENGIVIDFAELKSIVDAEVISKLHETDLNERFKMPTAENIAVWIYNSLKEKLPGLKDVELWETENCYVRYDGS